MTARVDYLWERTGDLRHYTRLQKEAIDQTKNSQDSLECKGVFFKQRTAHKKGEKPKINYI